MTLATTNATAKSTLLVLVEQSTKWLETAPTKLTVLEGTKEYSWNEYWWKDMMFVIGVICFCVGAPALAGWYKRHGGSDLDRRIDQGSHYEATWLLLSRFLTLFGVDCFILIAFCKCPLRVMQVGPVVALFVSVAYAVSTYASTQDPWDDAYLADIGDDQPDNVYLQHLPSDQRKIQSKKREEGDAVQKYPKNHIVPKLDGPELTPLGRLFKENNMRPGDYVEDESKLAAPTPTDPYATKSIFGWELERGWVNGKNPTRDWWVLEVTDYYTDVSKPMAKVFLIFFVQTGLMGYFYRGLWDNADKKGNAPLQLTVWFFGVLVQNIGLSQMGSDGTKMLFKLQFFETFHTKDGFKSDPADPKYSKWFDVRFSIPLRIVLSVIVNGIFKLFLMFAVPIVIGSIAEIGMDIVMNAFAIVYITTLDDLSEPYQLLCKKPDDGSEEEEGSEDEEAQLVGE